MGVDKGYFNPNPWMTFHKKVSPEGVKAWNSQAQEQLQYRTQVPDIDPIIRALWERLLSNKPCPTCDHDSMASDGEQKLNPRTTCRSKECND